MATRYLYSGSGSPSSPYTTADWDNAAQKSIDVEGVDAAGDTIYVSSSHNESYAPGGTARTMQYAGVIGNPVKIICVNPASAPPTALATGAVIEHTGQFDLQIQATLYFYGIRFKLGSGSNSGQSGFTETSPSSSHHSTTFENCAFEIAGTSKTAKNQLGGSTTWGTRTRLINCSFKYGDVDQTTTIGNIDITGATFESGTSAVTYAFRFRGGSDVKMSNVDFTNMSTSGTLFWISGATVQAKALVTNSRLPDSFSGSVCGPTVYSGQRVEMYNCDSGSTNYKVWIVDSFGTVVQDTGVYLDSGITDGTTPLSYKFTTTANCDPDAGRFYGPIFTVWNDTTGSSKTATVEIVHNSQGSGTSGALTDREIWLEVIDVMDNASYPLGALYTDDADIMTSASDQASSSATWTGDSAGWDIQKLSVAFTPQKKGPVRVRVVMGVASKTVYVDPNVIIT